MLSASEDRHNEEGPRILYCTLLRYKVRSFHKIFRLSLLTTSTKSSSSSTKKMASIPAIESEVDFHVERAGKPCKTVRCPFSFISSARCNVQHRAFTICSKAFKLIFSITAPLGPLFSTKQLESNSVMFLWMEKCSLRVGEEPASPGARTVGNIMLRLRICDSKHCLVY